MPAGSSFEESQDTFFTILNRGLSYSRQAIIRVDLNENQVSPTGAEHKRFDADNFHDPLSGSLKSLPPGR